MMNENDELSQKIAMLEDMRSTLGDKAVDSALAVLQGEQVTAESRDVVPVAASPSPDTAPAELGVLPPPTEPAAAAEPDSSASSQAVSGVYSHFSFARQNLEGRKLTGNFNRVNFSGANLKDAHLSGEFQDVDFVGADMCGATLNGTFFRADFTDANLLDAQIEGTFEASDFSKAKLPDADHRRGTFHRSRGIK
jgi:hypothetical protein